MMRDFFLFAQFFMHRSGCLTAVAHGEDNSCTTANDVTTRKDSRDRRLHLFVNGNTVTFSIYCTLLCSVNV